MNPSRTDLRNGLGLLLAVAVSLVLGMSLNRLGLADEPAASASVGGEAGSSARVRDASGAEVAGAKYQRILSGSTVSDQVLSQLVGPERIVAFTKLSQQSEAFGYRYRSKPGIESVRDVEVVLGYKPDLVVVSSGGSAEVLERLRRAGLNVFDLGEMRGMQSLLASIDALATLLQVPERGVRLRRSIEQRAAAIAADVPASARPRALYASILADKIYGGTTGTSFRDVLELAGLRDAAQGRYSGWPRYDAEQLLELDPEVLVTHASMAKQFCAQPALERLKVCRAEGKIVELPDELLSDPGFGVLESATLLRDAVHGPP